MYMSHLSHTRANQASSTDISKLTDIPLQNMTPAKPAA